MRDDIEGNGLRGLACRVAGALAWSAAAFTFAVSSLLLATHFQLRSNPPLESPALRGLMERLAENPGDAELREQIRALDLLARRAYFTSRSQIQSGGYLLLAGIAAWILAAQVASSLRRDSPNPLAWPVADADRKISSKRRAAAAATAALATGAFLTALFGRGEFASRAVSEAGFAEAAAVETPAAETPRPQENAGARLAGGADWIDRAMRNWPGFRGPLGLGSSNADPPADWDGPSGRNVLWKTEIPRPGFNSPVVWEDRVFVSGADREVREVYCFAAETGEILWRKEISGVPGSPPGMPKVRSDTGYAAPTLAADGERVYALFANGDLAALDFDGEPLWARNFGTPKNHYGHSSSPIACGRMLFLQIDQDGDDRLLSIDGASGEIAWEAKRDVELSWASPVLVPAKDGLRIALTASPLVSCYEAETGERLWEAECMAGEVAPSLAFGCGLLFAANVGVCLAAIDFETGEIAWETEEIELPEVSSPLCAGELLVLAGSYGSASCLEARTGKILWTREYERGFYSSPVAAGGRIYLFDKSGLARVFAAADGEVVAECALGEETVATPALAGDRLYIRGARHLFCLREGSGN